MLERVLQLLALWAALFSAFAVLGAFVARRLGVPVRPFAAFWLGVAPTLAALQWWNLLLPVGPMALVVFTLVCVGCGAWLWRAGARPRLQRLHVALVVAALPLMGWVAGRALQPCAMEDSGVYHLGAIAWAAAYPVVPGIVNLHPFLGVGHAFFPLAAMLSHVPGTLPLHCVPNGLFIVALGGRLVELGWRRGPFATAAAALVPAWLAGAVLPEVSTVSSDVLELALGGAFVCAWLEAWGTQAPGPGEFTACVVLAAGVVLTKFSSVGVLFGVVALALPRSYRLRAVVTLTAMLTPWAVATLLRTGVLPYPGAVLRLPVDWRVPTELARGLMHWTLNAGRMAPRWDVVDQPWFGARMEQLLSEYQGFTLPVCGGLLALAATAPWWWGERRLAVARVLPVSTAFAVWLASSPLLRYAGVWVQAMLAVALVTAGRQRLVVGAAGVLALLRTVSLLGELNLSAVPAAPVALELPVVAGAWHENARGTRIFMPTRGNCWAAPLPCSTFLDPELTLLEPGVVGGGFRFDGDLETARPQALALFPEPTRGPRPPR